MLIKVASIHVYLPRLRSAYRAHLKTRIKPANSPAKAAQVGQALED
ncbi:MAG: hypothetical protein J0I20_26195 [Chloroflexi bacterium]|nr:hypothetical protein [Chloroflexota bacterium]